MDLRCELFHCCLIWSFCHTQTLMINWQSPGLQPYYYFQWQVFFIMIYVTKTLFHWLVFFIMAFVTKVLFHWQVFFIMRFVTKVLFHWQVFFIMMFITKYSFIGRCSSSWCSSPFIDRCSLYKRLTWEKLFFLSVLFLYHA